MGDITEVAFRYSIKARYLFIYGSSQGSESRVQLAFYGCEESATGNK